MSSYGKRLDDSTVRFERRLPGSIDEIWAYLTDGERRAIWFCGGETELRPGGHVDMHFHHAGLSPQPDDEVPEKYRAMPEKVSFTGKVIDCAPPRSLSFAWDFGGASTDVSYELAQDGDATRLVLTHGRLSSDEEALSILAGWHTHLDILEAVLAGDVPPPFWSTHAALEAEYEKRLL